MPTNCSICGIEEVREHMLYKCWWTEAVWFGVLGLGPTHDSRQEYGDWMSDRREKPFAVKSLKERWWKVCMITC